MQLTTLEPLSPAQIGELLRAVRAVDASARVSVDGDGFAARIVGDQTPSQATAAIRAAGIAGVLGGGEHVPGGSTCCGGCS